MSRWVAPVVLALALATGCQPDAPRTLVSSAVPLAPSAPPVVFEPLGDVHEGSTIALARLGTKRAALVADRDALRVFDLDSKGEIGAIAMRPIALVVTRGGDVLVALAAERAIAVVRRGPGGALVIAGRIPTRTEPVAIALSPDERTAWVATAGSAIEGFDLTTRAPLLDLAVAPGPRALIVSQDGTTVLVGHGAAGTLERVDVGRRSIAAVDLGLPASSFSTPETEEDRARNAFGAAISPGGFFEGFGPSRTVTPARVAREVHGFARSSAGMVVAHVEQALGDSHPIDRALHFSVIDAAGGHRTSIAVAKDPCPEPRAIALAVAQAFVLCPSSVQTFAFDASGAVGAAIARVVVPAGASGIAVDPETSRVAVFASSARRVTVFSMTGDAGSPASIELDGG